MRLPNRTTSTLLAALLGACAMRAPEPEAALNLQSAREAVANADTLDHVFAAVEAALPGFAGIFYDDQGSLNIRLKGAEGMDEARKSRLIETLTALLGDDILTLGYASRGMDEAGLSEAELVEQADLLPARFDYGELNAWYERTVDISGEPGIVSCDLDKRANRISFGIEDLALEPAFRERLQLLGIVDPKNWTQKRQALSYT